MALAAYHNVSGIQALLLDSQYGVIHALKYNNNSICIGVPNFDIPRAPTLSNTARRPGYAGETISTDSNGRSFGVLGELNPRVVEPLYHYFR